MSVLNLLVDERVLVHGRLDTELILESYEEPHNNVWLSREQVLALSLELFNIGIHMESEK
jgi:hypothetical protein